MKPLPSFDYLHNRFHYDPETGALTWRNGQREGRLAGYGSRYLRVMLGHKEYKIHRIIWKMMTASDPADQIDHKNLDKKDNRWSNLREATHTENLMNSAGRKARDLPKGVYPYGKRYYATAMRNGKISRLGIFDTPSEAYAAYSDFAKATDGEFFYG